MRLISHGIATLMLLVSLAGLGQPVGAGNLTNAEDPINLYNQRQYGKALTKFQALVKKNPKDARAHYYMGLCYQALTQIKMAQTEYMWVYNHSSDKRMQYNAWVALSNIDRWSAHRAYEGQGNCFAYRSGAPPIYKPSAVIPPVSTMSTGSA